MYGCVGNSFVSPRVQMYPETKCIKYLIFPVGGRARCVREYASTCSSNREHIKINCQQ